MAKKQGKTPKQDNPEQSKRFVDTAQEVGAVGNDKAFARVFDKIAKGSVVRQEKPDRQEPA